MNNTSDFADVKIDAEYGITTPAVHHGLKRLVYIMAVLAALHFVILGAFTYVGILPELWSLGLLAVPIGWCLWKLWHGPDSVAALGDNHPTWYIYYVSLAMLYVLPPVQLYLFG